MEIEKRAESIMQCISSIWNTGGCIQGCDYVYIETQIKEIKREAADVQPVKRGEWEKKSSAGVFRCSLCQHIFMLGTDEIDEYHFCPNCGAKLKIRYCPLTTYPTNCKDNCTECIYAENVKEEVQMAIDSGDNRYEREQK